MTDYKKLYEDAIFRMNKWVESSEIIDPKEVAEFVFPELKESEDERTRKEIIDFVKSRGGFNGDWIAWLEKQGEHANFINKIQIGDKVTRNEDGVLVNLSQLKRVAKKDEKQGEQKPAWSEEGEKIIYDAIKEVCNIEDAIAFAKHNETVFNVAKRVLEKVGEQKSTWSEEYDEMMKDIIDTIQFLLNTNESWSYLEDHLDWLKSLKERMTK